MEFIETLLAILLCLGYIVVCKWLVARSMYKFGISDFHSQLIGYITVVIIIPLAIRYYFLYEIQGLTIAILVSYSMFFIVKQISTLQRS